MVMIVNLVKVVIKMVMIMIVGVPQTVENVEEVVLVQDVGVQVSVEVSVEVGPVDVEGIKGSLFVLFFAYLSDK